MSVLIKGMEMPESCRRCPLRDNSIQEDPDWCYALHESIFPVENSKEPNCPIIEIPDGHGRLIDADALIERMFDQLVAKTMMFGGQYVYTKEEIDNAPTVIPSDKDGET